VLGNWVIREWGIRKLGKGVRGDANTKWFDDELKAVIDNSMDTDACLEELKSGIENLTRLGSVG